MPAPDDDLELLRAALKRAPTPDPAARAEALRRAMENFDATRQGSTEPSRSMQDRPSKAGVLVGIWAMLDRLTPKVALGAGASLATLAIAMVLVTGPYRPGPLGVSETAVPELTADAPAEAARIEGMSADIALAPASGELSLQAPPVVQIAPSPEPSLRMSPMSRLSAPKSSVAPAPVADRATPVGAGGDSFAEKPPQALQITAEAPVSTFSVDVDTASWAWARSSLRHGQMPDPASVRLEEMVNYFPYDYPAPSAEGAPFATAIDTFLTPWNPGTRLVRIGLQGKLPATEQRPPLNLVFLIDTSGSMQGEDRIGLLKTAFTLLLGSLRPEDKIAIVAYAGSAGEVLPPTKAEDRESILAALNKLEAGGSTAGGEGLELAYATAAKMAGEGQVNRVVLATDGDFNLGPATPEELKSLVEAKRKSGTYLSVLGFGRGNLDDALMQALAQNGNGQAAYVDSAEEARKVLVDQAAGALFPIADDVKIQVEWNPAVVAEYRLLGYETRALAREDFADDKVDAGEIGAGHQVTALYEITPVDSTARLVEPLRYGQPATGGSVEEAGWLRLRWKAPGASESALIEAPIPATVTEPDTEARFAAAIAGFAQLMTGGKYLGDWSYPEAIALAEGARGVDPFGYRIEAVNLMRMAEALAR